MQEEVLEVAVRVRVVKDHLVHRQLLPETAQIRALLSVRRCFRWNKSFLSSGCSGLRYHRGHKYTMQRTPRNHERTALSNNISSVVYLDINSTFDNMEDLEDEDEFNYKGG